MQSNFTSALLLKILSLLGNNETNNTDEHLFGKDTLSLKEKIYQSTFAKKFTLNSLFENYTNNIHQYNDYFEGFQNLYILLNDAKSKDQLIELVAFFILGKQKVKLSTNTDYYWTKLEHFERIADHSNAIDANFRNWKLPIINLKKDGLDIKLHFTPKGALVCFGLRQYFYSNDQAIKIEVEPGDTVIDAGACWGDTALHFAEHLKGAGKVYSFEFIPRNKEIFNLNLSLNPRLMPLIKLVNHPLGEVSGTTYYYQDKGPGSILQESDFDGSEGTIQTLCLDDFMEEYQVSKVDFIKMDIEGAELPSLKGAIKLLTQFRPKLAISIYHSMDDFVNIVRFIDNLNLGYKFYLGHYTIHSFETVLYAKVIEDDPGY